MLANNYPTKKNFMALFMDGVQQMPQLQGHYLGITLGQHLHCW